MTVQKQDIIDVLKKIYDPEIPVNIWDLGLVYGIDINPDEVVITMTFTSPTCPMMEELMMQLNQGLVQLLSQCHYLMHFHQQQKRVQQIY